MFCFYIKLHVHVLCIWLCDLFRMYACVSVCVCPTTSQQHTSGAFRETPREALQVCALLVVCSACLSKSVMWTDLR